jgi:carboxypeptidase Taq
VSNQVVALKQRLAELEGIRHAGALLGWDQQTMMPPHGAEARAESIAALERVGHRIFTAPETGELLSNAAVELESADPDGDDFRLVKVVTRRWDKARRVPTDLAAEIAYAAATGHEAWVAARRESDFQAFAPYLERNLSLAREYVSCFDEFDCPYDALLDDFEPEMKTADVSRLFAELRARLVPLIGQLADLEVDDSLLNGSFPLARQRDLVNQVLRLMGFEPDGWRLDDTTHPFAVGLGAGDVRLTTRWSESYLPMSLYSVMHECGHGLYEDGIAHALRGTPLAHASSLGLHESQSRMWENMVGRGRPFCGVLAPMIAQLFDGPLVALDADRLFRAVNRVKPSLIRVEADEATYALHIVLRFELEQELIDGKLDVADLPQAWNTSVERYLGLEVPDDALGVLQDVHWSGGMIGYFPTYALGNLIAAQLWQRAESDIGDLDSKLATGELLTLREWLREHVHRHGAKYTTAELLERTVGSPILVGPFVDYLHDKLSEVYGVTVSTGAEVGSRAESDPQETTSE